MNAILTRPAPHFDPVHRAGPREAYRQACEPYRSNIRSPEIITFDELFYRARFTVENISRERHDGA